MVNIKFGTDGWRAIIAKEYTIDNLKRVAEATGKYMQKHGMTKVVLGFDCRFGGKLFAETTAAVIATMGIKVVLDPNFSSTPMVSLGVVKLKAGMGVVITASHNPPSYSGYKLKSSFGGPTIPAGISEVEGLIPDVCTMEVKSFQDLCDEGMIEFVDLEQMYIDHVEANFDLDLIKKSGMTLAYDAMYGAGQNVIRRLFPKARLLHCEYNPSFHGQAPEPIHKNLKELSELIKNDDSLNLGLANDGDADRIGMYDEDGEFVDSHKILLLLLYYMYKYKKETGKVVVTFSVTNKMQQLAEKFGLDFETTPIGFKYIAEIMLDEEVLVGGEESGGLAVKGHIPERDGIWMGLVIMEFMAKTGKSIKELVQIIFDEVGSFAYDRDDVHLTMEKKLQIVESCKAGAYSAFGSYKIDRTEDIDGYKFIIDDDRWVLIRPSGTEPVLRVYAQAPESKEVRTLLDAVGTTIL